MSCETERLTIDAATDEVAAIAAEHAAEVDRSAKFPGAALTAMRETGLLGLLVPVDYGGMGGDLRTLVRVVGRVSAGCLSAGILLAMHCQQVETLVRHAKPILRERLLPEVATGRVYLGSVTTDDTSGGLLAGSAAALQRNADGWRLHRVAPIVTGGRWADGFLIKAADDCSPPIVRFCYVDRSQVTVEEGAPWQAMGMRGTENVALTLAGQVPDEQVIGDGKFREVALETFAPVAHLGWSAAWLGAARSTFASLMHLSRRGDPVARINPKSDLDIHRLARIRMRLEVVSAYLAGAVDEVLHHRAAGISLGAAPVQMHLNTLKVVAAEETLTAAREMMILTGLRTGYLSNSQVPVERLVRDLHSASLNYDDRRLMAANGGLCFLDTAVTLLSDL